MICQHCGHDNPDGAVYCECGRPLKDGAAYASRQHGSQATAMSSFELREQNRYRRSYFIPIVIALGVLFLAGFFYVRVRLEKDKVLNKSKWTAIDEPLFSMTVPSSMTKDKMETVNSGEDFEHLGFFTSPYAGFDVSLHRYSESEKSSYSELDARSLAEARKNRVTKVNGQVLIFTVREEKNYVFTEYDRHAENYIGRSDDLWNIQAMYPTPDGYYVINIYCDHEEKASMREAMLQWLDSFKPKKP